jgi:peptidoglycan hydrolase FlgJ
MSPIELQLSAAVALAKPDAPRISAKDLAKNPEHAAKVAEDFEAVFINQTMGAMFEGIKTDGPFGGGHGEGIFRSMMIDQYSKIVAAQGGLGLAAAVKRELMRTQEAPQ